jgi:hypothetical protein
MNSTFKHTDGAVLLQVTERARRHLLSMGKKAVISIWIEQERHCDGREWSNVVKYRKSHRIMV